MYNKVELCGVNTAELPVLSEQEKRQLLTRARAGDQSARQSMIEGNLRLVLSVVQRFAQRGENLDDLFQVGCIGLIKAIDNFDPAQEVRFSTYGVPMIIGEIRRFLRDNNALRVSRSLRDTAYRAMQSREQLEKKLGREPTVEEIARQAGMSRREVAAALESVVEPISLEEPVYTDGGDAMYVIDQVRDPDGEDSWISGLQFRQTVAGLTPGRRRSWSCATSRVRPRWRWQRKSASVRHRSAGWKRPRWGSSEPGKNNKTGVQSPERADRAPVYCDIFRESVDIYGG